MARRRFVLLVVALITAASYLGGWEQFVLSTLKASEEALEVLYASRPAETVAVFFLFYVVVSATSLPGGAVLTMGAGAIFGTAMGTLLVSFASTIGATLAFLLSRYALRSWLRARFGAALAPLDDGIARHGARYLFMLRLVPVIPFFLVNFGMGLTRMPAATYYWVSQLSMLAGTLPFAHAGERLGEIQSAADVLSPGVVGSLVLLGLLPFAAHKFAAALQRT